MPTWALAASVSAAALALVFGASALQAWAQAERSRRLLARLELLPNVLLTRWPVAFVSGPRTAFWRVEYWSFAPRYLAEHGFESFAVDLPWRGRWARETALLRALERFPTPCHLIFDQASETLLEAVARARHPKVASATLIKPSSGGRGQPAPRPSELSPQAFPIHELEIERPLRRASSWPGPASRLGLALHRAALAARGGDDARAPRGETIAAFDESLRIERRILDHAISLAESDAR